MGGRGASRTSAARNQQKSANPLVYKEFTEAEPYFGVERTGVVEGSEVSKWLNSLSHEQKRAIEQYSGDYFNDINNYLRFGGSVSFSNYQRILDIEEAISKFEVEENIKVYREASADLIGGARSKLEIDELVGGVFPEKAFASTSTSKSFLEEGEFSGSDTNFYEILVPKGRGYGAFIQNLSYYEEEREFLLQKGTDFELTGSYYDSNNRLIVQLKVLPKAVSN